MFSAYFDTLLTKGGDIFLTDIAIVHTKVIPTVSKYLNLMVI